MVRTRRLVVGPQRSKGLLVLRERLVAALLRRDDPQWCAEEEELFKVCPRRGVLHELGIHSSCKGGTLRAPSLNGNPRIRVDPNDCDLDTGSTRSSSGRVATSAS